MFFPFYFDPLYFVFALPALFLALWAQWKVQSTYQRYLRVANRSGINGQDAAYRLLNSSGLSHISVQGAPGHLTDHYNPANKTLNLSQDVAYSPSVAAMAIVAHEVGHAVQDKTGYFPLKLRTGLVPAVNLGSYLGPILFFIGLLLNFTPLAWLGLLLFSAAVIFAGLTLPVELDASRRALTLLTRSGLLPTQDLGGAKAMLNAAALTYFAALAQALSNLLYYAFILLGMRRRS